MKATLRALFGVSALALLLAAAPAMADESVDVDADNANTGADSKNENEFDIDNDNDFDLDNDGDAKNEADADVNTGGNKQKGNTTGGSLDSGGIDASTDWASFVNEGADLAGMNGDVDVKGGFSNDTTGAWSKNENDLDFDNDNDVDVDNVADVLNKLGLWGNTGYNKQKYNTTAGDNDTGDIGLDSAITNEANNDAYAGGAGSTSVDVDGANHLTGADSKNENEFDIDNKSTVTVKNDADFKNKVDVDANTGGNTQKGNTTAGDIDTGNVDVITDIHNSANNGSSSTGGGSDLDVTADFANDTTGYDSKNENELDVDNDHEVTINNEADVENNLEVEADTGDNTQKHNTEGGDISTGDVSVDFNVTNSLNNN